MILRPATANDAAALAAVHAAAFDPPWSVSEIAGLLASPGGFALAAQTGPALIGFILCRVAADEAEILTLVTMPAHRRVGVAAALLEAAAGAARAGGASALFLEVADDNAAARALYAGAGFHRVGARAGYYAREAGAAAALVLRRELNR